MKPLTRPVRRNPTGLIFSTENRESMRATDTLESGLALLC